MPKIVLVFVLVRFSYILFFFNVSFFSLFFLVFGFFSVFIGLINAMFQLKIKRFLAYSSISTIGFILIGLSQGTIDSFLASIFYVITYLISLIVIFYFLLIFRTVNFRELFYLYDMVYFTKYNL
jgi:NADH:ubiquinone oxidoreductase subunit 2 (subunit N)